MTLITVLLFDLLLLVVLGRLIYKSAIWTLAAIADQLHSATIKSIERRRQLSHPSALATGPSPVPNSSAQPHRRLVSAGGVGGTTVEDCDLDGGDAPEFRFPHRHLLSQRTQQRLLALERHPPPINTPSSSRRDWVAITHPTSKLEIVRFPQLIGITHALVLELTQTRAVHWLLRVLDALLGRLSDSAHTPSRIHAMSPPDLSPFACLPSELLTEIILLSASPSLVPDEPASSPVNVLLVSKQYYKMLLPRLYHTVSLHTPFAFRSFRLTLALHNPGLGKLVRRLQVGSSQYDTSGYIPGQLAEQGPLATGIEQMLLATPNLLELSIDLFSLVALHAGTAARLEKGCQPRRLSTELTIIPYLSLPTFEDLRNLELLVFGMDRQTALELRIALPRLESLTLRFVTRRRSTGKVTPDQVSNNERRFAVVGNSTAAAATDDGGDDDDDEIYATPQDVEDFIDAIDLLRTWPEGDSSSGTRLTSLTIFTWPSALHTLKSRIADVQSVNEDEVPFDETLEHNSMTDNADCSPEALRAMDVSGEAEETRIVPSPLYAGVDKGYLLGPRRGTHVLWRKSRARAAWS